MPAILVGWLLLGLVSFSQPWGQVSADTKLDLIVDPGGFLSSALNAYTDIFTLGQLQNQAYGYLFPQGPFFLLTDPLPDWVAQRLWWWLVMGVGYSGFYLLARRAGVDSRLWAALGALGFALSPRVLSTLTTISSETWPVMLAPWVILPFLADRLTWRHGAAAVIPVALMGAVNATATLAACVPAAIVWLYRRQFRVGLVWLAGCALVSLWWIGPLLILGRYAPPFTDYIESSFVTTRWLNLAEVLRGTTSWSPFVDTERSAGVLLTGEPVFVLLTMALAALGLAGLVRLPQVWSIMLLVGAVVMAMDFAVYLELLDGPLAPLRNLHKFDVLVHLPLLLGLAYLGSRMRLSAATAVATVVVLASAPAWTGRLLPEGSFEEIPAEWQQAANFLNANAQGTRTLIYPPASFARQDWGWTRDEPLQPLLDVPWATRDAIPLVPPEAIRGLDGVMRSLEENPQALSRLGIGAVVTREGEELDLPGETTSFGDIDVTILDAQADMHLADEPLVRVAGGGEVLGLLDMANGPATRKLVDTDADIVTDTPLLVDRNYGTLEGPVSAPLAPADPSRVHNQERDYASVGPRTIVRERGGQVAASSSAADADSFGGAQPEHSITAAVDGEPDTSWKPAPGETGWLELRGDFSAPTVSITATADTTVTVGSPSEGAETEVELKADEPVEVKVPGGDSSRVRISLSEPVGLSEVEVVGHPIERVVTVPDTSPDVQQFFFQQMMVDTSVLIREFTAPRQMDVTVEAPGDSEVDIDGTAYRDGEVVSLSPGLHRLRTEAEWVSLRVPDFSPAAPVATDGEISPSENDRVVVTGRAFNDGLRATLDGKELTPLQVDAATQAFRIPAGAAGSFAMRFEAQGLYRGVLVGGGALAALTVMAAAWLSRRTWSDSPAGLAHNGGRVVGLVCLALLGWQAAVGAAAGWAIVRFTTIPASVLTATLTGIAGAVLARAPWPAADYAGDSWLVALLCAGALGALMARPAGVSTSS